MDMQMSELDGHDAAGALSEHGWDGAITAHAMDEDRAKRVTAGCDDYATRLVNRVALIDLLHEHLQRTEES